ncbi:tyrosine-type recombinase/integrase [Entomospira culicis]|uniref:Tyrosine-type recombinase/integrase n=1 Tax=Entomospira culicis TaxID=2719989 RepID=A0A968KWF8_9SPIO|nr:tyrosine-type recombinase/integrase [Entomospira culicis]NIZ19990.1 tyrosine-type recombinase/integrase [Entomospira culicis]NIZ70208.1 tyrosine-type recombinase/integrase [Entomospira culicis]WDI38077.1 tyrosine-type recombinase/integrase [Entomospira culicis]WDI39700.1 tyrosine-type recombinase/integrase [Entomospira culicis]
MCQVITLNQLENFKVIYQIQDLTIFERISNLSPQTIKNYRQSVKLFFDQYGADVFENLRDYIKEYIIDGYTVEHSVGRPKGSSMSLGSQRVRKFALKAYFTKILATLPDAQRSMLEYIDSVKLASEVTKAVTQEKLLTRSEIELLLGKIKLTPKQEAILTLLYQTGLRASEAVGIKLSDIQSDTNIDYYRIKIIGKGNKLRYPLVQRSLINQINQLYNGSVYLFETASNPPQAMSYHALYRSIKAIEKKVVKAGITLHPHKLRHSFASHSLEALKEDASAVSKISKYLGHSSTSITMDYYLHGSLSSDDLIKIHQAR